MADWSQYLPTFFTDGKGGFLISKGALFGMDGTAYATLPNPMDPTDYGKIYHMINTGRPAMTVDGEQVPAIPPVKNMVQDFSGFRSTSIVLGTDKFMVPNADTEGMYARKGSEGFFIRKTNRLIIVAFNDDKHPLGPITQALPRLVDYLKQAGY